MAISNGSKDKFANVATITVTESAANTLTWQKLETGFSLTEKVAWVISRIEWYVTGDLSTLFNAANDRLFLALTVYNGLTTLASAAAFRDPTILDMYVLSREDFGAAASGIMFERPFIKDFSNLPGGGLIVPPAPLYMGAQGVSLASASTNMAKIFYNTLNLKTEDYWELVEARRVISS